MSVVAALALPFAPVSVNQPQVSWPTDPAAPTSTMLMLSAYRPLALEASISCGYARSAASTPGSLALATTRPDSPRGTAAGLVASSADGVLSVTSRGTLVAREPIGADPCRFRLLGEGDSLVLSRDGRELGRGPMPDVDALVTSVVTAPGATTDDMSVRLTVDDGFSTSPSPAKVALIVVLAISACGAAGLLVRTGRREELGLRRRLPRTHRPRGAGFYGAAVDALVVVTLGAWLFLAPLTLDDGYYSAMAANAPFEGYVGNYYQLFNQGFTPFSWIYQALAGWQHLVGFSPVALRVPALAGGLLTWVCVRRLAAAPRRDPALTHPPAASWRDILTTTALAVAFLAWWMPFDMGLRPETVIALATVASLLCLVLAAERGSLLLAGAAVGVASLGVTAAPTGLVTLAPLIAGLPAVWPLIRGDDGRLVATGRSVCVLAPGAVGAVAAFGDGSWRDFVRAQELLSAAQEPETWYTEYRRWGQLLESGSSTYAHRAAVLVTVLALLGLLVLWAAGRARFRPLPDRLVITGATTALAFLLLSPTPSKPWMHFGAIAGVGAVFLALMIVNGPGAVRDLAGGRRLPRAGVPAAVAPVVLTLALAGSGVNTWFLWEWSPRLPNAGSPPQVGIFRFDQPLWWILGVIVVAMVVRALASRRFTASRPNAALVALSAVVALFLAGNVAYLTGTFGLQAVRTLDSWSVPAQNLRDPFARECGAGSQVEAADPAGSPLAPDRGAPAPGPGTGFAADAGWPDPGPPLPRPSAPAAIGWGSLDDGPAPAGARPGQRAGNLTTPWFTVPPVAPDQAVTSLVSGRTGEGNSLTVEYGRRSPAGVEVLGMRRAEPGATVSPAWRGVDLASRATPPPSGTDVLRLVAVDGRTDVGGWIAFTAPRTSGLVPVQRLVAEGAPTAISWRLGFLFPCLRQPRIQNGITEPATWAIGAANDPLAILREGGWQTSRGDVFGQTGRQAGITQLVARFRDAPDIRQVQVYRLRPPYASEAYTLGPGRRTVQGWSASPW